MNIIKNFKYIDPKQKTKKKFTQNIG